jgi:hypothetical protein
VVPQSDCDAIRSLQLLEEGPNVRLSWLADPFSEGYRVYVSGAPGLPRASWTIVGETPFSTFLDPGGATGPDRFYSVVCTVDGAEGPW